MNILIVDDNQNNRMTIELLLEDMSDVDIEEAVDGAEAISMCKEQHFDLIFMDIMMPNVNGIEATKEIKTFCASSMIIAISALDDEKSKHGMLQSGAEDYITKPIDAELFVQRVKNYMTILTIRAKPFYATAMASLFSDSVFPLSKIFTINSEDSLVYFWDYFLNTTHDKAQNISDVVRLIYGIGLWLLKTGRTTSIVSEENDDNLYITHILLKSISERVITNLLLKHSPNTAYILKEGILSFKLNKVLELTPIQTSSETKVITSSETKVMTYNEEILSKTHFNKVDASAFVESTAIGLMDKLESLENIEDSLDISLFAFENENTVKNLRSVSKLLLDYVEVIIQLVEFEHLSHAISSLARFLENLEESQFDEKKVKKLVTLTIHFISDLGTWRINIFIKQEANDIHYLDSSLLSSCLQIESIFQEEIVSEDDNEDDLEFF